MNAHLEEPGSLLSAIPTATRRCPGECTLVRFRTRGACLALLSWRPRKNGAYLYLNQDKCGRVTRKNALGRNHVLHTCGSLIIFVGFTHDEDVVPLSEGVLENGLGVQIDVGV